MNEKNQDKENNITLLSILAYLIERKKVLGVSFIIAVIFALFFYISITNFNNNSQQENSSHISSDLTSIENEYITIMSLVYHIPGELLVPRMGKTPRYFLDTFSKDKAFINATLEKVYLDILEFIPDENELDQLSDYILTSSLQLEYEQQKKLNSNIVRLKFSGFTVEFSTTFLLEFVHSLLPIAQKQLIQDAEKSIQLDYSSFSNLSTLEQRIEEDRYKERINEARKYLEGYILAYSSNIIETEKVPINKTISIENNKMAFLKKLRPFIPVICVLILILPILLVYFVESIKKSMHNTQALQVLKQAWRDSKKKK